jgi:hypothetical protein
MDDFLKKGLDKEKDIELGRFFTWRYCVQKKKGMVPRNTRLLFILVLYILLSKWTWKELEGTAQDLMNNKVKKYLWLMIISLRYSYLGNWKISVYVCTLQDSRCYSFTGTINPYLNAFFRLIYPSKLCC